MFNLVPAHCVCLLGIAGIGTLPYGLRWLFEGEVSLLAPLVCRRIDGLATPADGHRCSGAA